MMTKFQTEPMRLESINKNGSRHRKLSTDILPMYCYVFLFLCTISIRVDGFSSSSSSPFQPLSGINIHDHSGSSTKTPSFHRRASLIRNYDNFVSLRSHHPYSNRNTPNHPLPRNTELGASSLSNTPSQSVESSLSPSLPRPTIVDKILQTIRKCCYKNQHPSVAASVSLPKSNHDNNWTKQNLAIALPALMGLLADPLLTMVDTAFIGQSNSAAAVYELAALGVCTSIFHMAFTVFRASTVATTSLVGNARTKEEKQHITHISLGFAGVVGTLVLLVLRLGGHHILTKAMGVSPTSPIYDAAKSYLLVRCWAAPAVIGIVVAEGAFRGNHDNATPVLAALVAALLNLVLDPLFIFSFGMGLKGAALATAISQLGAAAIYAWKLCRRRLMVPQKSTTNYLTTDTNDTTNKTNNSNNIRVGKVLMSIMSANLAMLSKNFSMLVFYSAATARATLLGATHAATHQVCLSIFWFATMWLDSGGVSAQLLLSRTLSSGKNQRDKDQSDDKTKSLIRYMLRFGLAQGLAFSMLVFGVGQFAPTVFTQDSSVIYWISKCLPHLAIQQTLVSLCLVLEGLAIGGNQFRILAWGTAVATTAGLFQLRTATSVLDIWTLAVNTFFGARLINGLIGVGRVRLRMRDQERTIQESFLFG